MTTVENISYGHTCLIPVVWEGCGSWVLLWERYVCVAFAFYESVVHCLEASAYKMS